MLTTWQSPVLRLVATSGGVILAWAALHDIAVRTVPNRLAAALACMSLAACALQGHLLGGIAAGLMVFALAAPCWWGGWMGGGDVKLLAAAAFALTPATVPLFLAAVALAGGGLALLYLAARPLVPPLAATRPAGFTARVLRVERRRIRRGGPLPYACAIAAGSFFVLM
jgi:prepilin peptidase CpaA